MGSTFSRLYLAFRTLRAISDAYAALSERLSLSPGIPVPNPSTPYWAVPAASIARHGAEDALPDYADLVVIGSGITGTAASRTILDYVRAHGKEGRPLKVVMLEARDACSGATARNGGHITPPLYQDYAELKKRHGALVAQTIIRFRLSHLPTLLSVAESEGLLRDSQCREVDTFDVFFDSELFDSAKTLLSEYKTDLPRESEPYKVFEQKDCSKIQISPRAVGCITTRGGALHPYRLVTGILSRLLHEYPGSFNLFTHTPCTGILSHPNGYTVTTPKGTIHTPRILHATNGWTSHLLPPMRRKVVPARGNMSAQRPGQGLGAHAADSSWSGARSFVFYPTNSAAVYDYLTQQPPTPSSAAPASAGELMFGGGFMQGGLADRAFFEEVGNVDDRGWNLGVAAYLSGALGVYFGDRAWGAEGRDERAGGPWGAGRVKALWSGVLGISADFMPWVGRLPPVVSGRREPTITDVRGKQCAGVEKGQGSAAEKYMGKAFDLAPPGEWISAGYSGEGMVHAWMSGTAVAHMLLGRDEASSDQGIGEWFPDVYRVTEDRWRKARIEDLLDGI